MYPNKSLHSTSIMGKENSKYASSSASYKDYDDRNRSWKSSVEYKRLTNEQRTKDNNPELRKQNQESWKLYSNTDKKMDQAYNRQTKKGDAENKSDWKKLADSNEKKEKNLIDL